MNAEYFSRCKVGRWFRSVARLLASAFAIVLGLGYSSGHAATAAPAPPVTEQVLPGLTLIKNGVNTAVFERNGRKLLITPGDLTATPGGGPVDWVLVTHHHRDEASGVGRLIAAGAKLVVPAAEEKLFADAENFWKVQAHSLRNFRPSRFTVRESVPVARTVKAGDILEWEGLKFEVIDTPGHTDGSVTYLVELDGRRIAFTGDLIYGPGQIWEMYSLQNRYGLINVPHLGFGGEGEHLFASLERVLSAKPHLLIPSHGVVMRDPRAAVQATRKNFDAVMDNYLTTVGWPDFGQPRLAARSVNWSGVLEKTYPDKKLNRLPPLPPATYPPWIKDVTWTTQAILGDNRTAFLSDCGRSGSMDVVAKIKEMTASGEIRAVEGIWPTHYHSDHSELLDRVRQATGAKVYVQREMVDITENPEAYGLPYMSEVATKVDRVMTDRQTIDWRGVKLTFYYFPGQTLYHAGLLAEKDGFKAFFTGDSWANWGIEDYCTHFRCFVGEGRGFDACLQILLECKPDILVQAHRGPMKVTEEYLRRTLATFRQREALLRRLLPYDDPNYGLDPYWTRAYPYRQRVVPGDTVAVEARITNHSSTVKTFAGTLRAPQGWKTAQAAGSVTIAPRGEGSIPFRVVAPAGTAGSRHVLGIAISRDGQPLGELAEAIVDISAR